MGLLNQSIPYDEYTTIQRNLLVVPEGFIIKNSDNNRYEIFFLGAWRPLHTDPFNSGSVKITSNGDTSEPSFNLVPGVPQQILYTAPLLDAETYFPETAPVKDVSSIYAASVDVGGTPYAGIFLENPVKGQPQIWRVSFNYLNKPSNQVAGIQIRLRNPVSGFERFVLIALPEDSTAENFVTANIITYNDNFSAPPAGTGGYQFWISCTRANMDVVIKDITRLNSQFNTL